jgi:7-cyano-7-deazaguanine synthase
LWLEQVLGEEEGMREISSGMSDRHKAVVLLSGGMDSCVTAAIARERYSLALLHVSYGQRTEERERRAFDEIADYYGASERLAIRLDAFAKMGGSALTDERIAVPQADGDATSPAAESRIPVTYVPFRNAHFLSAAVSWAEVIGARAVFIGAVEEDSSGYPDCRPEYYRVFSELVRAGTKPETQIEIVTPVIQMRKREIIRRGIELGAPLDRTWSCYQFEEEACGACESCRLRLKAFAEAGVRDPIAYRVQVAR